MRLINRSNLAEIFERRRGTDAKTAACAAAVIAAVRKDGDRAIARFTEQFDGVRRRSVRVSAAEIRRAKGFLSADQRAAIVSAASRIGAYHQRQMPDGFSLQGDGSSVSFSFRPIRRIGIYIPGGQSPLISTVLMTVIPANVAGVGEIAVCSPPSYRGGVHPAILETLVLLGVKEIYAAGGAQAVAALAYGTSSIPKVDLIAGPGNAYVDAAKRLVFGDTGIDLPAGPSEVVVFADAGARKEFVLADLKAQMEHTGGSGILVTTCELLGREIAAEISGGYWIPARTMDAAGEIINDLAPEHLQLFCRNGRRFARNLIAGAIFIGPYAPAAFGDYYAGPSHVLPTGRTARFTGGLSVFTFLRGCAVMEVKKSFIHRHGGRMASLAALENLPEHTRAIALRGKEK